MIRFVKKIIYKTYLTNQLKELKNIVHQYDKEKICYLILSNLLEPEIHINRIFQRKIDILDLYNYPLNNEQVSRYLYSVYKKAQARGDQSKNDFINQGIEVLDEEVKENYIAYGFLACVFGIINDPLSAKSLQYLCSQLNPDKDNFMKIVQQIEEEYQNIPIMELTSLNLSLYPNLKQIDAYKLAQERINTPVRIIEGLNANQISFPPFPKFISFENK